jgi:aspartate aminotransferase
MYSQNMITNRVAEIGESITIKLNGLAKELMQKGQQVYNLTVGQLEFLPDRNFIDKIGLAMEKLSSFQYTAAAGNPLLIKKIIKSYQNRKNINSNSDLILTNGAKSGLSELLATLIGPQDEVLLLTPYWPTYLELVKYYDGIPVTVDNRNYLPDLEDLENKITQKTKLIVLNSPNNPSGMAFPPSVMKNLATVLKKYPNVLIVSDEIYYYLNYNCATPTYPYHFEPALLERTIIVDGISKYLAATGLRLGFLIGPPDIIKEVAKLQGQTASSANSLIQNALLDYDINFEFIDSINKNLLANRNFLKQHVPSDIWYEIDSAFYFILDFTKFVGDSGDHSAQMCEKILSDIQVSLVPITQFGLKNGARISLSSSADLFNTAITKLFSYLDRLK